MASEAGQVSAVAAEAADTEVIEASASDTATTAAPDVAADAADTEVPAAQPKGRGRRGRGKEESEVAEPEGSAPEEEMTHGGEELAAAEPPADTVDAPTAQAGEAGDGAAHSETAAEPTADSSTEVEAAHHEGDDVVEFTYATPPVAAADAVHFEPAMFTIADLPTGKATTGAVAEAAGEQSGMAVVEAREATEFVPAKLDIDVDALRSELTDIATVWLGPDDAAPVAQAIGAARPGVDDFVSTIRAIGAMEIPGHELAVVRAMAREMHFRASEVLCGV